MKPSPALRILDNIALFSPIWVGWGFAAADYMNGKPFNPVFIILSLVTAALIVVLLTTDTPKS